VIKRVLFLSLFVICVFVTFVAHYFSPVKKGCVIILDGVSSSGKTSIADCLMKHLDSSYEKVALDDYVADVFLKKSELHLAHKDFVALIRKCREHMYKDIKQLTACGKNILLDTVLSGLEGEKDIKIASEQLKNLVTIKILIYCPLPLIAERIEQRNGKSFFDDKPKEMRSIAVMMQFCNVYKIFASESDVLIGALQKKDVEAACMPPDFFPQQDIKIFNMVKDRLLFRFGLQNKGVVKIAPRLRYDLIVNTSECFSKKCARKIYKKIYFH